MKLRHLAVAAALLSSCAFNGYAQINTDHIEQVIEQSMARFDVPGMAVAIVENDQVIMAKGFGVAHLNKGTKVDKDTLFGIASNTKAFTSAALAKLIDQGKLSWDDKVIDHLPEFRLYDPYVTREMTIRDLLSHRSGLGLGQGDLMIWPDTDKSIDAILAGLKHLKPASSFRSQYAYNNLMFVTAGEVVARVSGMSWNDYIEKNILQPLHMDNSRAGFSRIPSSNKNWATGHIPLDGQLQPFFVNYLEDFRGAGAIASSASDMSQWLRAQLAGGKMANGEQLFSEQQQQQMWHPHITSLPSKSAKQAYDQQFRGYGLGWSIDDFHGTKKIGHGGGILGMVSQVTLLPEKHLGIVILSNQQAFSALSAITYEVLEEALELDQQPDYENKDWIETLAKKHFANKQQAYANATPETPADYQPQLPSINYTGTLHDAWYGDVIIEQLDGKLRIDFTHTKRLKGNLAHYTGNTFIVKWDEKLLEADAYIEFQMDPQNRIESATMRAVSTQVTDFSFDFRNLKLIPKK
ncbi:serine hydrolase [Pseudoalteromonas mariniglutinosa]|uniref:serine hydrolase n=1 Tax=Pseudoalteromonas mariniglutinosa TaxID=206042 RepID=UPI00384BA810